MTGFDFWIGFAAGLVLMLGVPSVLVALYILFWDNLSIYPRSGKYFWQRKKRVRKEEEDHPDRARASSHGSGSPDEEPSPPSQP